VSEQQIPSLELTLLEEPLSVCRLCRGAPIPGWGAGSSFWSATRTADELSVVCAERDVPPGVKQEPGWRALKLQGPFDLSLVGILASVATPLAEAGVNVFVVATYDTDYVLVKEAKLASAVSALSASGHSVTMKADLPVGGAAVGEAGK
jgi:hypothetical protein